MTTQQTLFEPPARKPKRVRMHAADTGYTGPVSALCGQFVCRRCGYVSAWIPATKTEVSRGIPCPACNPA
jgi:hypothetical protein